MEKKKVNHKLIRRIILLGGLLSFITAGIVLLIVGINNKTYADSFMPHIETYDSTQTVITPIAHSANAYISMTEANSLSTLPEGKIITIETPEEFKMFSTKCESNNAFLGYNYELLCDIDFEGHSTGNVVPIGYSTEFSGSFNGNGYEIKNIPLIGLSTSNNTKYLYGGLKSIQYFALFSKNSGNISNLGLENAQITITYSPSGECYVAPFVGLNTGEISHCYSKETRSRDISSTGLVVNGGFYVSGFVSVNNGNIHHIYSSRTILLSSTSTEYLTFSEIMSSGTAPTQAYFYDSTINSFTISNDKATILFNSIYVKQDLINVDHYGTYESSINQLTNDVVSNDQTAEATVGCWYNLSRYTEQAQTYLKDEHGTWIYSTPIARGIVNDSYDTTNGLVFTIANERELSYMYELFLVNKSFATSVLTFKLTKDMDMGMIHAPSYQSDIGCNIIGAQGGESGSKIVMYNAPINEYYSKTIGINCFGVFPWLTGNVSYIDVELGTLSTAFTFTFDRANNDNNRLAIGALSGYVDGGTIDNCNVYINISFDNAIGKYFFGGIAGIVGSTSTNIGKVSNATINGSISQTNTSMGNTVEDDTALLNGMVLGGAIGYLDYTTGSLDTVLSKTNITANGATGQPFACGGVVGAGYANKIEKLQYEATMNLTNMAYQNLYTAGIVGRLLGETKQATKLTNKGNITVDQASNTETYVTGIMNVDIITSSSAHKPVSNSPLMNKGKYYFYGSSFTNIADIVVNNGSDNLYYTEVLNIKSSNHFSTELSGIYNMQTNSNIILDIAKVNSFSPILNNIGGSINDKVNLQTSYNFKSFTITTTAAVTKDVTYAGVAIGDYISYANVHNLGNFDIDITNSIGVSDNRKNIKVLGVFTEVSSGCKAESIYNAGTIDINYTANIYGNVYASGICYANRNGYTSTEITKYNPANTNFDSKATGSMNNVINNGEVKVTSTNFSSITYSAENIIKSGNGKSNLGNTVDTTFRSSCSVYGNLFASGITSINESVITNAFNIADVTSTNYVQDSSIKREINSAGISILNIGMYAYILNSANDGDIKAYNMSSGSSYKSETNASGISCKNDELENGTDYAGTSSSTNKHSSQVISFTINYGSVFSYNYRYNITSTNMEPTAKSAGILAMGLCNVINVVNYGNIYGSETASGVFGIVYYVKFTAEVTENIYIANTLNYGNVYMLERGYNNVHGSTYDDYNWIEYSSLISLDISTAAQYALTSVVRNTDYISVIGSIFSIVNFANANNTENIKIRYLISYNEDVAISGAITAYPLDANPDVSTFYSAHITTNAQTGAYATDTYIGKYVQYAPLISKNFSGRFVTYINPSTGDVTTQNKSYNGVFSNDFAFMKAINKEEGYLNINTYNSDAYISDYFDFVGAIYVNDNLLKTIGWSEITYRAAAEAFATDINSVGKFVNYISGLDNQTPFSNLTTNALNVDTWLNRCNNQALLDIIDAAIKNDDAQTLLDMFDYIFVNTSSSYSLITSDIRGSILDAIISSDLLDVTELLSNIITYSNGYSALLGDSTLNDDSVGEYLEDYIESLSDTTIEDVLRTYCNYLSSNANSYFSYKNTELKRKAVLEALFENITDNTFYLYLAELINVDLNVSLSSTLQMYNGYNSLNNEAKVALYKNIILNNQSYSNLSNLETYINAMSQEIGYFSRLIENGYSKTSLSNITEDIKYNESNYSTSVIDERVALWNQIRNTEVFEKYLQSRYEKSNSTSVVLYDLATEYNNTYQSVTEPHNTGTYIGDTKTNRLSYLYTLDITPEVYFYGPYVNSIGSTNFADITTLNNNESDRRLNNPITNDGYLGTDLTYHSLFHCVDSSLWASTEIMKSRGGDDSTVSFASALNPTTSSNTRWPVPMLIYYDFNNEQLGGADDSFKLSSDYYVSGNYTAGKTTFRGFDGQQFNTSSSLTFVDPMLGTSQKVTDWVGTLFTSNDLYMYVSATGERFSLNNASVGPQFLDGENKNITLADGRVVQTQKYRCYIKDSDGANHLVQATNDQRIIIQRKVGDKYVEVHTLKNYSGKPREVYSFLTYELGITMWTSTVNTNYHSTARTGIYRHSDDWDNYFTWKQDEKFKTRVFTSQYIDYNINDLLNLDGVLTEYDGVYKSTDERNIINRVFNEKLVNDSSNFSKVIAAALLERNMYDSDFEVDYTYLDNFFATNIYSTTTIGENHPFAYLYRTYNSQTVKAYLDAAANGVSTDNKSKFIAYCASNQSAYVKLILRLMELKANEVEVGSSTDTGAISITNVTAYNDAYLKTTSSRTIHSESFTEGLLFNSVTFTIGTTYQTHLYVYPKGESATLTVKLGSSESGTNYTITTSNNNYLDIVMNGETSLTLEANDDVILYKVTKDVQKTFNGTYTYNKLNIDYTDATQLAEAPSSIYIDSAEEMATLIESYLGYNGVSVLDGNFELRGYNNSDTGVIQDFRRRDGKAGTHYSYPTSQGGTMASYTVSTISVIPFYNSSLQESNLGCYWDLLIFSTQQTDPSQVFVYCDYSITSYTYYDGTTTDIFTTSAIPTTGNKVEKGISCNTTLGNSTNYNSKYSSYLEDALYSLIPIDYSSVVTASSYSDAASKNLIDLLGLNATHDINEEEYDDFCIECLIKLAIKSSNEAFLSFVKNLVADSSNNVSDYEIILKGLVNSVGYYPLLDAIKGVKNSLNSETKKVIAAAYLATDYQNILDNSLSVSSSRLKYYIDEIDEAMSSYQYINGNSYIDAIFIKFAKAIGYSLSTAGYGIYALASSYGVQDGTFIPDNLVLSTMNPYYTKSNNKYEITSTTNSYWRKGSGETDDATTDTASVNHAFFEEMKQLKESISTAIIELDLTDGTNTYMANSNQVTRNGVDGTITYYITTSELASVNNSLTIDSVAIANKANLYINSTLYNSSSNKTINVTKNGASLTTTDTLKVVAEDESVYTVYSIIFVVLDDSDTFTLNYAQGIDGNYPYTGGTLTLDFTSNKLPKDLDLTPYITISKSGTSYNFLDDKTVFNTYFSYYTYGNYQVIDEDHKSTIKFEIFRNLPYGTYTVTVAIGSNSASKTFTKAASEDKAIVKFEFDNDVLTLGADNTYSSEILFGRTFNKEDLVVPAGTSDSTIPSYLSAFEISDNATYQASASKSITNGIMTYTITYTISPENGGEPAIYTHVLTEKNPYNNGVQYASVYLNGVTASTNTSYTTSNYDSVNNVLSSASSANVEFSRDLGIPEYRIKYDLSNFYITSDNFSINDISDSNEGSGSGVAAIGAPYAGITATITKACNVGTYRFEYTYTSYGTWDSDNDIVRKYVFPIFNITKLASTDSWINSLTFIDNYTAQSTLATKLSYEIAFIPNENTSINQAGYGYDPSEIYYSGHMNSDIQISQDGSFTYAPNKKVSNKNYYVLGSVNNASLASYAPTMGINEYAEVYQYLNLNKAKGLYGGSQSSNDTALLATSATEVIYLYLPYYIDNDGKAGESEGDTYEIFLVKMTVSNGIKTLSKVYQVTDTIYSGDTENTPFATLTNVTLSSIHSTNNTFTKNSITYKISQYCGQTGNSSLYMNYIGDPKDGHFWYVSYAVFSEAYLDTKDSTSVDYYHVSIIDLTNNIYFTITVNIPEGFTQNAIYMNINYVTYVDNQEVKSSVAIYAIESDTTNVFVPIYQLSMLPSGYYTFTLELPNGYTATYTASRPNKKGTGSDSHQEEHEGSYLPTSSIVPIQIDLVFTVTASNQSSSSDSWGMGTTSTSTVKATYQS